MAKVLKAALVGLGAMGRGHLSNYIRLTNEGDIVELIAVCDVDEKRFEQKDSTLNIGGIDTGEYDFSSLHCYTDIDEMLAKETELDFAALIVPTYLHRELTVKCLDRGLHVFCEKPMALTSDDCQIMIDAAKRNGKQLMIGQCLRFWGEYNVVKDYVDSGRFGRCTGAYFFRGGEPPKGSYKNWYMKKELCGGAIRDQHVHDVDIIQYIFGMPKAVQTVAQNIIEGSGYDNVSTNYIFDDLKTVNAQNDWTISGVGFDMSFRVNFERGTIYLNGGNFLVCPKDGEPFTPEYNHESAYYAEVRYFADCIREGKENTVNPPEASMNTIKLVESEIRSADNHGIVVML